MRKRITCRVIHSVQLGKGGLTADFASRPSIRDSLIAEAVTYTHRLTIVRTCLETAAVPQRLDLYV